MADLSQYPYRARTDVRSAIGFAIRTFVSRQTFALPDTTEPFKFAAVYDDWATFNDTASTSGGKLPAAVVLPDRPVYEDSALTPRMIESTWSGGDPHECIDDRQLYPIGDGTGDGFALFTIAELAVPMVLLVRAANKPMRRAIVKTLEQVFVEDGGLLPDASSLNPAFPVTWSPADAEVQPIRYGRLLPMPAYYDRKVRVTLLSQQLLTNENAAQENRWLAQFELAAQAQVCVLRRVRAMKPRVRLVVNESAVTR